MRMWNHKKEVSVVLVDKVTIKNKFSFHAALHNPTVVAECGGIGSILRNVLDCHHFPRVNESLLATVLYLLNHPRTRGFIRENVDLEVGWKLIGIFTNYLQTGDLQSSVSGSQHSWKFDRRENSFGIKFDESATKYGKHI